MQKVIAEITHLEAELCDPEIFTNHEKILQLQEELSTAKEQHELFELEWLELNEELENIIV